MVKLFSSSSFLGVDFLDFLLELLNMRLELLDLFEGVLAKL